VFGIDSALSCLDASLRKSFGRLVAKWDNPFLRNVTNILGNSQIIIMIQEEIIIIPLDGSKGLPLDGKGLPLDGKGRRYSSLGNSVVAVVVVDYAGNF
jgi:hypothetical protein